VSTGLARECLLRELDHGRDHVLRTVEGLSEQELDRVVIASGWTPRSMLNHLRYDAEIFWIQAVLGGDRKAIDRICNGWEAPAQPGPDLLEGYRTEIARSNGLLQRIALEDSPAWWPPREVFGGGLLATGWDVVLRVLSETSVHAGHLDVVRELIDGHQDLVVT
jgi:hypothetical protein